MRIKPTKLVITGTTQARRTTTIAHIMLYIQSHLLTVFPSCHVHIHAYTLQAVQVRDSTLYLVGVHECKFFGKAKPKQQYSALNGFKVNGHISGIVIKF